MELPDDSRIGVFAPTWSFDTLPKIRKRLLLFLADIETIELSEKVWIELSCISLKMEIARLKKELKKE